MLTVGTGDTAGLDALSATCGQPPVGAAEPSAVSDARQVPVGSASVRVLAVAGTCSTYGQGVATDARWRVRGGLAGR